MQRTTVIVGDLMLFWALRQFCYTVPEHHKMGLLVLDPHVMVGKQQTRRRTTSATSPPASRTAAQQWAELCVLVMAFVNPGLLLVDHIHFQYNGFLLGIFIWSLTCIARVGHAVLATAWHLTCVGRVMTCRVRFSSQWSSTLSTYSCTLLPCTLSICCCTTAASPSRVGNHHEKLHPALIFSFRRVQGIPAVRRDLIR